MNSIRKVSTLVVLLFFSMLSWSQTPHPDYLAYIENYSALAQRQQSEYGIPASITLSQGLLESGAGKGYLAVNANNHFGIKCSNWTGESIFYDDDALGECFRKYPNVIDSYEDHSLFLKNRIRYASLFEFKPTDYKSWAFGLKAAGYATDSMYAQKLIKIIEDYGLHRFDGGSSANIFAGSKNDKPASELTPIENTSIKRTPSARVAAEQEAERQAKAQKASSRKSTTSATDQKTRKFGFGSIGSVMDFANHTVRRVNGVSYVEALYGDTHGSIADEFNIDPQWLLSYNDLNSPIHLEPGDRVFLNRKKKYAARGLTMHTIEEGESMYSIAQNYGMILESLYKLNNMAYEAGAKYELVLRLRKMKQSDVNPLFGPDVKRFD